MLDLMLCGRLRHNLRLQEFVYESLSFSFSLFPVCVSWAARQYTTQSSPQSLWIYIKSIIITCWWDLFFSVVIIMLIMQTVIELSTEEINSDVGKMPREQMRKNRNEAIHKKSETPRLCWSDQLYYLLTEIHFNFLYNLSLNQWSSLCTECFGIKSLCFCLILFWPFVSSPHIKTSSVIFKSQHVKSSALWAALLWMWAHSLGVFDGEGVPDRLGAVVHSSKLIMINACCFLPYADDKQPWRSNSVKLEQFHSNALSRYLLNTFIKWY